MHRAPNVDALAVLEDTDAQGIGIGVVAHPQFDLLVALGDGVVNNKWCIF